LATTQRALLAAAADLPRPGGALVYAACTWTVAETTAVVGAFLDRRPDYTAEEGGPTAGTALPDGPGRLLRPDLDGTDGMYLVVLRRR
ncbi:MAG: hypothetical protein ACQETV_06115, partial [Actinomycetota bacterium]